MEGVVEIYKYSIGSENRRHPSHAVAKLRLRVLDGDSGGEVKLKVKVLKSCAS